MPDRLYTTNQLAKLFGVVPTTVIDWIERGKLEAFKTLGGHRRITHGAVIAFLRRNKLPFPPAFVQNAAKIVLVDADADALKQATDLLQRELPEAQVFAESHPIEALMRIGVEQPHLVVFDVRLPDVDAAEFCRRLRTRPTPRPIRLLALGPDAGEPAAQRVLEAGADQFLVKAKLADELVARCRALVAPAESA